MIEEKTLALDNSRQETMWNKLVPKKGAVLCVLPSAFSTMANRDPKWNMDTVKDFLTHHILFRCDSSGDLYPVTSPSPTPHALLSNWPVHQLDVKNAFLNGDLTETIYMYQPSGFVDSCFPHYVCRLHRSLYGLKHVSHAWFQCFAGYALRVGFTSSRCDSSLFIYQHGIEVTYLLTYDDDIVLTASSITLLQRIISYLHKEFDMIDLGALNYLLGISITRDARGVFLSQKKYAMKLLERAQMLSCNYKILDIITQ
nr:ribonuclease H-like domain-containing protein [Tanacetum cinerariifolium]